MNGFEITAEPVLGLFLFHWSGDDDAQQKLVHALNDNGRRYPTQGSFDGRRIIRFTVEQCDTTRDGVMMAPSVIQEVWEDIS